MTASSPLVGIAQLLAEAGVSYAVIGGHAVNVWLEPRFTADVDITVAANSPALERLAGVLRQAGYVESHRAGVEPASGPDFVRWTSSQGEVLELQLVKTSLQAEVVRRAVITDTGVRVASREDLIVLKLIADRAKDRIDLEGLCALDGIDWTYVEEWARAWDVGERLARFRRSSP